VSRRGAERLWITVLGLALVGGLTALDITWDEAVVSSTVVLAPFITALVASPRQTAVVAAAATLACLLSGLWNDNFGDPEYLVRVLVVAAGAVFAVLGARARESAAEARRLELQLTAALSNLGDAVTVQRNNGELVYANDAAARMLGVGSVAELMATPMSTWRTQFDYFTEDGAPLDPTSLPARRLLRGEAAPEPVTIRVVDRETGEQRWRHVKASSVPNPEGAPFLAVNIVEDVTGVKRAELAQQLLSRASEALASSLDYERTLQQVADLAVPELADWCTVSIPGAHGVIRPVAVAHSDPAKVEFALEHNQRYPSHVDDPEGTAAVLRDGQSQLVPDIPPAMIEQAVEDPEQRRLLLDLGLRSVIIVPLVAASGRPIGTLSLVQAESGREFTEADLGLAEELGRRAGIAVENARLYTERSRIAHTLQASLLPPADPVVPGFSIASLYRPAGEENWVGGDFYAAFATRRGWMIAVGDVAGRGASAAALTALSRHTLKAAAQLLDDPLAALDHLNRELLMRPGMTLCTMCCMLLEERDGGARATVTCAGHPQPLLVRDGNAEPVGEFGTILGAWPEAEWPRTTLALEPGDVVVLYTDGVIDASREDERFGEHRLQEAVAGAQSAEDAVARITAALDDFEQGEQADDTAVIAIGPERVYSGAAS
jgi:PAS domain S-box-containing protein